MSIYKRQTKQETVIYTIVWIILFMVPVVELIFNYDPENPVWLKHGLLETFGTLLLFLVVFLIHNHILAPMLIHHKKVYQYIACCVVMVALFQTVQCIHHPHGPTPPRWQRRQATRRDHPASPCSSHPTGARLSTGMTCRCLPSSS